MPGAVVVLPTFNEAGNILNTLDRLITSTQADVLVVDDSSPDGTAELVEDVARDQPRVHLMRRRVKSGLGDAYRAGFAWAFERDYDVVVQMDSDLSHDPAAVPELLARIDAGAELVIGSRYVPGGAIPNWPLRRRLLSSVGNRYACALLGLPIRDVTSGFRAWRRPLLENIRFAQTRSTGYVFLPELAFRAKMAGARIEEVPITFRDREQGTSKMSIEIMVESMARLTVWGLRTRLRHRQLSIIDLGRPVAASAPPSAALDADAAGHLGTQPVSQPSN